MAKKKSASGWKALNLATNLGITMAASVLIGYYMGHYLTNGYFTILKHPG